MSRWHAWAVLGCIAVAQLAITRENLASQQDTLDLSRIRFQAGLSSDLDVARAEAQGATTASMPHDLLQYQHPSHLLRLTGGMQAVIPDTMQALRAKCAHFLQRSAAKAA